MKSISINLNDKDHELYLKIAKSEKRRPSELAALIFADGLGYFFCEECVSVKKTEDDYTEEDRTQQKKNEELEKTEGWNDLSWEERTSRGYVSVEDYWQSKDITKFENQLIDLITSNSHLTDEEVES